MDALREAVRDDLKLVYIEDVFKRDGDNPITLKARAEMSKLSLETIIFLWSRQVRLEGKLEVKNA